MAETCCSTHGTGAEAARDPDVARDREGCCAHDHAGCHTHDPDGQPAHDHHAPARPLAETPALAVAAAPACPAGGEACGCHGNPVFDGLDPRYRRVLWTVILINAAMFVTEIAAGHWAGSQALQADALDFLGDTLTYGLSLAVIGASLRVRASAALVKGASLSLMGLWVLGSTAHQVLVLGLPRAEIMGGIGLLALAANLGSVLLLMRYKDGDANVRSVWLCSRNDAIGNVVVMVAALGVWSTASAWPDLAVATVMAALFLHSSALILRQAVAEWRDGEDHGALAGHSHGHPSVR